MGAYQVGQVIKFTRESLGITQEELCGGICSVDSLSKIENGKRVPNRTNFQALMERLGKDGERYLPFIHGEDVRVMEWGRRINTFITRRRFLEAEELLEKLESVISKDDMVNQQFMLKSKTVIQYGLDKITLQEMRRLLEQALLCTVKNYKDGILPKGFYSKMELLIFCNIAVSYSEEGNQEKAISMFRQVEDYYQKVSISIDEKVSGESSMLANLGQCLSVTGAKKEAVLIEERAVQMCIEEGMGNTVDALLLNLFEDKKALGENEETCKELLLQAYYVADFNHNQEMIEHIKEYIKQ